jgi:uncharacterized membrane protein
VGRLTDIGIDDKFMKQAAGALTPGQAALCVLVSKVSADKGSAHHGDLRWQGAAHEPDD